MALLDPPQILPNAAEVIYRYLLQAEKQTERRETLVAVLSPASLEQNLGQPGSKVIDDTLRACEQIRLTSSDADAIRLNPDLPDYALNRRTGKHTFRYLLRKLILTPELNDGDWGSQKGARDLTYSLAWYLRQDLYSAPALWDLHPLLQSVQLAQQQQLGGTVLIVNDTRWGAFMRWSTYLGFAVHHALDGKAYLVPDPTVAVRDALADCCVGKRGEVDLPSVIDSVAEQLPVLDRGTYRKEVELHLHPDSLAQVPPGTLSTSLGHALRRLEDSKVITLSDRADAPSKVTFTNESGQRVVRSHLSWTKPIRPAGELA
jgi:hypothetical protein